MPPPQEDGLWGRKELPICIIKDILQGHPCRRLRSTYRQESQRAPSSSEGLQNVERRQLQIAIIVPCHFPSLSLLKGIFKPTTSQIDCWVVSASPKTEPLQEGEETRNKRKRKEGFWVKYKSRIMRDDCHISIWAILPLCSSFTSIHPRHSLDSERGTASRLF